MNYAALYLRSTKDRSDVSIAAQRKQLQKLAREKKLTIIEEYSDVVESAKSVHRPGFQKLVGDLKSPIRQWSILLMVDHSRLSRERFVSHVFAYEAKKEGVEVIYANLPDELDSISRVILESVLVAMSEVHSLMSRQKGLSGMSENISQGYRAGGRPPRGYQLERITTGAIREGQPVEKTRLTPSDEANIVKAYLSARASNVPRAVAKRELKLPWSSSSLIDMEWNALTYAGHTTWDTRNPKIHGGYEGGTKRKPRSEWTIQENTHPPLISIEEAEIILSHLESGKIGKAVSAAKSGKSNYLLTGLLKTPTGQDWIGNAQKHYRTKPMGKVKGRWISLDLVDDAVMGQVFSDLSSQNFVKVLTQEVRQAHEKMTHDPTKKLRAQKTHIDSQITKASKFALQLDDPAPMLDQIRDLQSQKQTLEQEIECVSEAYKAEKALSQVTENQVKTILATLEKEFRALPKERWKGLLRNLISEIVLDPATLQCSIHYRVELEDQPDRLCMASPRGVEPLLPP